MSSLDGPEDEEDEETFPAFLERMERQERQENEEKHNPSLQGLGQQRLFFRGHEQEQREQKERLCALNIDGLGHHRLFFPASRDPHEFAFLENDGRPIRFFPDGPPLPPHRVVALPPPPVYDDDAMDAEHELEQAWQDEYNNELGIQPQYEDDEFDQEQDDASEPGEFPEDPESPVEHKTPREIDANGFIVASNDQNMHRNVRLLLPAGPIMRSSYVPPSHAAQAARMQAESQRRIPHSQVMPNSDWVTRMREQQQAKGKTDRSTGTRYERPKP